MTKATALPRTLRVACLLGLALVACDGLSSHPGAGDDARAGDDHDAGEADGGEADGGEADGGVFDGGPVDAGFVYRAERESCNVECEGNAFCRTKLCYARCSGEADPSCTEAEYCSPESTCDDIAPPPCPERACPPTPYECLDGTCVLPSGPCANVDEGDGCPGNSLCRASRCYALERCGRDDVCRVGTLGAMCNAGDDEPFPLKLRLCLIGHCRTDDHCPPDKRCVDVAAEGPKTGHCAPR